MTALPCHRRNGRNRTEAPRRTRSVEVELDGATQYVPIRVQIEIGAAADPRSAASASIAGAITK